MQSEQQINQTQTKKSTTVKKDKKPKSKSSENEQLSQQQETVVQQTVTPVSTAVEQVVHSDVQVVVNDQVSLQNADEVVVQEVELSSIVEYINTVSDKLLDYTKFLKDSDLSKDERSKVEASFKKLNKSLNTVQSSYYEHLSKQLSNFEKTSGSKSGGVKKVQDKEKSAIHKKLAVHPFLLNFMKLDQGTLVSRSDALSAITGYVKQEKEKNPDIIVESDKRSFKLIGELKVLFNGIEQIMKSKNLLEGKQFPTEIKYTQIMQYMTHCFVKTEETNVV